MRERALTTALGVILLFGLAGAGWTEANDDLQRANELYQSGDFDGALGLLGGMTSTDPNTSAEALRLTGYCYRAKTDVSKALDVFKRLALTHPDSSFVTEEVKDNIVGLGYHVERNLDKDIACARLMAVKYPDCAVMWRYLAGKSLKTKKSDAEAFVELLKAWDRPASRVNRGWEARLRAQIDSVQMSSDFDEMISDAKSALVGKPNDAVLWRYVLGYAYLCKGKYLNSAAELEKAARMSSVPSAYCPNQGRTWRAIRFVLGYAYEKDGRYDKALGMYREVAGAYPTFWRAHWGIFTCLTEQSKTEEASGYINKVSAEQLAIRERLRKLMRNFVLGNQESSALWP